MKPHQIIEIIGLLLILVSVGWELFFTIELDSIEQAVQSMRLHEKLDQLHHRQLQIQRHIDYRASEIKSGGLTVHGDPLSDRWNPSPHEDDLKRVGRQSDTFRRLKVTLFAIGSLLLLLAKVREYSTPTPNIPPSVVSHEIHQPTPSH